MPGPKENKASEVGMAKAKPQAGSGTIKSEEHVGASHPEGHRFRMPHDKHVSDHSDVHSPEQHHK